jgi:hypothetical protein
MKEYEIGFLTIWTYRSVTIVPSWSSRVTEIMHCWSERVVLTGAVHVGDWAAISLNSPLESAQEQIEFHE